MAELCSYINGLQGALCKASTVTSDCASGGRSGRLNSLGGDDHVCEALFGGKGAGFFALLLEILSRLAALWLPGYGTVFGLLAFFFDAFWLVAVLVLRHHVVVSWLFDKPVRSRSSCPSWLSHLVELHCCLVSCRLASWLCVFLSWSLRGVLVPAAFGAGIPAV